jgi:hypothetical protein
MNDTSRHPRVPFIRRAKAMAAVAIVTTTAVLASAASPALAATPPPPPAPTPVRQGQTITLFQVIMEECVADYFGVVPSVAGTVSTAVDGSDCRIRFTASSTYLGPVTVSDDDIRTVQLEVTNKNASIGATFTPKAAPGPCIQIVSGANIDFGDVTIGGRSVESQTETQVQSCAQINMNINATVSEATSGIAPNVVTLQPEVLVGSLTSPNTFRYLLVSFFPSCVAGALEQKTYQLHTVGMTSVSDSWLEPCHNPMFRPNERPEAPLQPGTTRQYGHSFEIGAGSSGVGQQFSTTVTLTAMAA